MSCPFSYDHNKREHLQIPKLCTNVLIAHQLGNMALLFLVIVTPVLAILEGHEYENSNNSHQAGWTYAGRWVGKYFGKHLLKIC